MEQLFSQQINPNLDMDELEAMCTEFKNDYNQRHFVRNDTFKAAAESITGETRKIFIEFLERSCTAEFSGFLLYKVSGCTLCCSGGCSHQMNIRSICWVVLDQLIKDGGNTLAASKYAAHTVCAVCL